MGLFDKLAGNQEIKLTPQSAFLLACITMIAVDGDVDDDEIAMLRRIDRDNNPDAFNEAIKVYKLKTFKECMALVAEALNQQQQTVVLANLIDIAMADGILAGDEKLLLEQYLEIFDTDEDIIRKTIDVITMKNDRSHF